MSEPPFKMPGHRWDSLKKRFFKIIPGQSASKSSSQASSSSKGSGSREGSKGKSDEQASSSEQWHASTPHLPAVKLRSVPPQRSAKHPRPFPDTIVDPITMKQQGRTHLTNRSHLEQPRVEAAYCHLALFRAMKPWPQQSRQENIIAFQTDIDDQSLLFLTDMGGLLRLPQLYGTTDILYTGERPTPPVLLRSRQLVLHSPFQYEGYYEELSYNRLCSPLRDRFPFRPRPPPPSTVHFPDYPEIARSTAFPDPIPVHDLASWALHEDPPPKTAAKQVLGIPEQEDGKIILAVTNCKNIYVFHTEPPGMYLSGEPKQYWSGDSDCMALTFSQCGKNLFCGLRSGGVVELPWDQPKGVPPKFRYLVQAGGGSVTQLKVVSETELVVVRINGDVELVDAASGEVRRRYKGHVNSYQFGLGCAVEPELRLLALAGLDRRVRVWSLDSALPLGTTAVSLSPNGQHHKNSEMELWDQSQSPAFLEAHPPSDTQATRTGSTLCTIVFPVDIKALHWNPRSVWEGCDREEAIAVEQEHAETGGGGMNVPDKRWKDLYVGAGGWVYQFRWP